jgi:hypothetical protein
MLVNPLPRAGRTLSLIQERERRRADVSTISGGFASKTITASRTPPMQSPADENLQADSIEPMLLGHPHAKSETICAQLRLLR